MQRKQFRWAVLPVLPAVAVQLWFGLHPPKNFSDDFQWAGARMILHRIDPWAAALAGKPAAHFSPPNYLHELYLLLLPLAWLGFPAAARVWQAVNLVLSMAAVDSLRRGLALSRFQAILLLLLLWASNPFRITLALGQQSMLELYLFCLFFESTQPAARSLALGMSYAKYSFSPVLVLYLALKERFSLLLLSLSLPLIGLLWAWWRTGGSVLHLAIEPLLVSRLNVCSGFGDSMTVTDRLLAWNLPPSSGCSEVASPLSYIVALAGSAGFALLLARRKLEGDATVALLALAPLLFFRHLVYDYVFLLVPLAYALKQRAVAVRATVFGMVLLFWYAYRAAGLVKSPRLPSPLLFFNFSLLLLCAFAIERNGELQADNISGAA